MLDVYGVMSEALGCLCEKVAATAAGAPCFCGLLPGASTFPLDACLCGTNGTNCGTAWVRLDTMFPSQSFPSPDLGSRPCSSPMAARIHVGVVRCVPGLDDAGNPPTVAQQLKAVEQMACDAQAAYEAAACCLLGTGRKRTGMVGQWLPLGAPDGHCVGGVWPVTVWEVGW